MKIAYTIGPYRADTVAGIAENIHRAEEVAKELWKMGFAVHCPHKNSAFFDGIVPDEAFLNGGKEILKRCVDVAVLLPGWSKSGGSLGEHITTIKHHIPSYRWPEDKAILREIAEKGE